MTPLSILLVEDDEDDAFLLLERFRRAGYELTWERVDNAPDMGAALGRRIWDVVLSDYRLPGFSGDAALELFKSFNLDIPFFIISGTIDEVTASRAMVAGAQDFLSKDRLDRLIPAVARELREARMRRERRAAIDAAHAQESRLAAIAANVPGMVFQICRAIEGEISVEYVSEGAQLLFGVAPYELIENGRLVSLILPEDRVGFLDMLAQSASVLSALNWEGRIRIPARDTKWINVRGTPRRLPSGGVEWEGVMWNITHSKHSQAELSASRAQLAELSNYLQRAKEEERERIARDIHDELGGLLVGIKIEASLLSSKLDGDHPQSERARRIATMVDEAISTSGRVARELRPGILKEFGLAAAIESHAEDFSQRSGTLCEVLCADHDLVAGDDTEVAVFRVFQEALTNVLKHAQAQSVQVRLTQEGDEVVLQIADDGIGIRSSDFEKPKSFGLRGMRERIASLGGKLEIKTRLKGGTELIIRAPITEAHSDSSRSPTP